MLLRPQHARLSCKGNFERQSMFKGLWGIYSPSNNDQNGVGAFILQCKRLDFHYCDWAGSSKGMKFVYCTLASLVSLTLTSFLACSFPLHSFPILPPALQALPCISPHDHIIIPSYAHTTSMRRRNQSVSEIYRKSRYWKRRCYSEMQVARRIEESLVARS